MNLIEGHKLIIGLSQHIASCGQKEVPVLVESVSTTLCLIVFLRVSEFSGLDWIGMVEWITGVEWWNGLLDWNGGIELVRVWVCMV